MTFPRRTHTLALAGVLVALVALVPVLAAGEPLIIEPAELAGVAALLGALLALGVAGLRAYDLGHRYGRVGRVRLMADLYAALVGAVVAGVVWLEDTLRAALQVVAVLPLFDTAPSASRSTLDLSAPPHRPRLVLGGSVDSLAPPASSSTRAARGQSTYGPEGAPPP